MKLAVNVTDLIRNFSDFVNRVVYRGEHFVVYRGGEPVAELTPVGPAPARLGELSQVLEALPRLGPDEAEAFDADLCRARDELDAAPEDPWAS